jgi:hypothetical protein
MTNQTEITISVVSPSGRRDCRNMTALYADASGESIVARECAVST